MQKILDLSKGKRLIGYLYIGMAEEFRRIFHHTNVQATFKGTNTLKSLLMRSKDKSLYTLNRL